MNTMSTFTKKSFRMNCGSPAKYNLIFLFLIAMALSLILNAQTKIDNNLDDVALLDSFIQSKYGSTLVFSPSNIKQFWIENSVVNQDNTIRILLNGDGSSYPLKIQLANVNETQDCKVDVISNSDSDLSFTVLSDKKKEISKSVSEDKFINYNIASASFHLEDTMRYSFYLQFFSKNSDELKIKRIVLSFSTNKDSSYLLSPGKLIFTDSNSICPAGGTIVRVNDRAYSFSTTKNDIKASSKKKICVYDGQTLSNSVVVKNNGPQSVRVNIGYTPFTKDGKKIINMNNPYKSNKIMKIVSAKKGNSSLIVDSEPEWAKGCCLALNAKEDLSDFPNFSFVDGLIQDVKKKDDSHYEIILSKEISQDIKSGTPVRVQCGAGADNLYTHTQVFSPGEEASFSRTVKVDNNCLQYNNSKLDIPRGTYYVVPIILLLHSNNEEVSVEFSDYIVTY